MSVPLGGQYTRSAHAVATPVGDRVVLYHGVSRTAIVLNPTGTWMWSRLERPRTGNDLAVDLRTRYPGLSTVAAERDVSAFLAELLTHEFVALG